MGKRKISVANEERELKSINSLNNILKFKYHLKFKNESQKHFANIIEAKEIIIASGPAGVGKSYVAIAKSLELLQESNTPFTKIVIAKPVVEADEEIGFLPGTVREKLEPHIASSLDIFDKIIGEQNRHKLEELGLLQIQPFGFIRGKSIDNTILIVEEAQNLSPRQCKTLLTRIGTSSKFIISGDLDQSDRYRDVKQSGLFDMLNRHRNIEDIGFYEFHTNDIVRHHLISKILNNYAPIEPSAPYSGDTTSEVITTKKNIFKNILNYFNW